MGRSGIPQEYLSKNSNYPEENVKSGFRNLDNYFKLKVKLIRYIFLYINLHHCIQ
jgi:hypothetical protein